MSGDDVSHADLMAEVKALRKELGPLVDSEFRADLKELVDVLRAARIGGKGLNWLANIVKAGLVLGGLWIAFKAGLAAMTGNGG
jgi:hypothetical protein